MEGGGRRSVVFGRWTADGEEGGRRDDDDVGVSLSLFFFFFYVKTDFHHF